MNCLWITILVHLFCAVCSARTVIASWKENGLKSIAFYISSKPSIPYKSYSLEEDQKEVEVNIKHPFELEWAAGYKNDVVFQAVISGQLTNTEDKQYIRLTFTRSGGEGPGDCVIS